MNQENEVIKMRKYVITNGDYYIRKDDKTNKYVPVHSLKYALQFDSEMQAKAILKNSISKSIKGGYFVKTLEFASTVAANPDKQKELCSKAVEQANVENFADKVKEIARVLSHAQTRKSELLSKLSDIDKQIVDIQHYIEFGKFNACQGYMAFKMLQNALRQRREYKNEIEMLAQVEECQLNVAAIAAFANKISGIESKVYSPRVLLELFETN